MTRKLPGLTVAEHRQLGRQLARLSSQIWQVIKIVASAYGKTRAKRALKAFGAVARLRDKLDEQYAAECRRVGATFDPEVYPHGARDPVPELPITGRRHRWSHPRLTTDEHRTLATYLGGLLAEVEALPNRVGQAYGARYSDRGIAIRWHLEYTRTLLADEYYDEHRCTYDREIYAERAPAGPPPPTPPTSSTTVTPPRGVSVWSGKRGAA